MILSFWIHRPADFPEAAPYLEMLKILDDSCHWAGFEHTVLTDHLTANQITEAGIDSFAMDLPINLMLAATEAPACWLESIISRDVESIFVGADCIVRRDFREDLPDCDLAVAFMKGHKKWRINTGFVYVPSESREKVAPLIRSIAGDTREIMCDDMMAFERALSPMPEDFGTYLRQGLSVSFLPLPIWNRYMTVNKKMNSLGDAAEDANVLHFMGGWENKKELFFKWAEAHGFA